jgi:hypothetical protein
MPTVKYDLVGDSSKLVGSFKAAGTAALALGAAYAKLIDNTVKTVDEVNTLANATGLSTNAINGLRLAARASGKELTDIVPSKLAKNMLAAADSGGAMADSFARVGVEFENTDGSLRDASEVFGELIGGLSDMENRTEAAAVAAQLLGKNGKELLTAFEDQEGFQKFVDLGNEFGTKTGPDAVKAAGEWQAATANLSLAFENAGASLLDTFGGSGAIAMVIEQFSLGFVGLTEFISLVTSDTIKNIGLLADFATGAITGAITGDFTAVEAAGQELKFATTIIGDAFDGAREKASSFWELQAREVPAAAKAIGVNGPDSLGGAIAATTEKADELFASLSLLELGELSADMFAEVEANNKAANDAIIEDAQRLADAMQMQLDMIASAYKQMGQNISGAISSTLGALSALGKEGGAAYKALFVVQKAAAIAGITVDTARGIMGAFAIPPPIGPALAATIGIEGAAQLANVVATSIGGGGGSVGASGGGAAGAIGQAGALQEQATAGAGEGRRAPGGGLRVDSSGGQRFTVVQFRHELYDATVPDSARIPGSAMSRVRKNGARVGQRAVAGTPRKLLA